MVTSRRIKVWAVCVVLLLGHLPAGLPAQEPVKPTFSTSVKLVSVAAVVRDDRGRVVRGLKKEDFRVLEAGKPRPIVHFSADDQGPISLAILFDSSGSMYVGSNFKAGRAAVEHVLSWVDTRADEVALFSFHRQVHQEVAFTRDTGRVRRAVGRLRPSGLTSIYDAIAQGAKKLADRPSPRRALVVITDGVDTSSTMSAQQVASLASGVDVPVYVIAVVSPVDDPESDLSLVGDRPLNSSLAMLAEQTGGQLMITSSATQASAAARNLITELRHQYLLAVESSSDAGWYGLNVRTRNRDWNVRARSGYAVARGIG
jgi:VWFA-related protein